MANPQLENGYTRLANELLDNIVRMPLTPYEFKVILFVIRKTDGYQKKMNNITNSQIVKGTGIYKSNVSRTISKLLNRRMLIRIGKLIGVQKDYELWLPKLSQQITIDTKVISQDNNDNNQLPGQMTKVISADNKKLSKQITKVISADNYTRSLKKKESINKRIIYRSIDPDKYIKGKHGHLVRR